MTDTPDPNASQYDGTGFSTVPPPPVEALSVTDKFIGIITEPSATYENVRAAGARTSDWIVPVLITAIVIGIGMLLRFSNPAFMATIIEQQTKGLAERVESGQMTQEQADQAAQQMESMSGFVKIGGTLSASIGFIIVFFVICLLYWLAVRFGVKGDATYVLILSAAGLSTYISCLDQLLSLLLSFVTDKPFANLSPALFVDGDVTSMSTRFLMMLSPVAIWSYYVLGIGFEKVANISRMKGMIVAFSIWILFSLLGSLAGFGGM
jgi:hypothetical protein